MIKAAQQNDDLFRFPSKDCESIFEQKLTHEEGELTGNQGKWELAKLKMATRYGN